MAIGLTADFGNVLGMFDKRAACQLFTDYTALSADEIERRIVGSDIEKRLESGQISDVVFARELEHRIKAHKPMPIDDVKRIWGNIFSPNPAIEPIIDSLIGKQIPICVLSNTNSIHWPFIADLPVMRKLIAHGSPMILSHQVKEMKPDQKMFATACASLKLQPQDVLFIDDIQAYVDAARVFGMRAERYDCTKDQPHELRNIFRDHEML